MSKKAVRVILSLAIVGGALGVLMARTLRQDAAFYKHVDEVMNTPEQWYGKSMKLHGFVQAGSIQWKPETLDYKFIVRSGDKVVNATYRGIVPDTFKDDAEVVLNGRLAPDGYHVEKDGVVAKCPSRYEAGKSAGQ